MYTGFNTPFWLPQSLELVNFLLLTSLLLIFYWCLHLIISCHPHSKGHKLSPHFHPLCQEQKHIHFWLLSTHTHKTSDLQFSLVILNNSKFLCLVIQQLLSALFIYLFIQFPKNCSITSHMHTLSTWKTGATQSYYFHLILRCTKLSLTNVKPRKKPVIGKVIFNEFRPFSLGKLVEHNLPISMMYWHHMILY